ncbi:hypothetical protein Tcan_01979 [Toxocara canis]|uniref:Uncharacterized protein n=1 Tax=Toxocara canis TaxID=6265 RepID=A0A0B2VJY2_TOXCA|nr:hypothetical protein Tcan_01979 [Toxocara canis]
MSVFVPQTLNDDEQRLSRLGRRSTVRRKFSMLVTINEDGTLTTTNGGMLLSYDWVVFRCHKPIRSTSIDPKSSNIRIVAHALHLEHLASRNAHSYSEMCL